MEIRKVFYFTHGMVEQADTNLCMLLMTCSTHGTVHNANDS